MNIYAPVSDGRVWARCSLRQVKRYEGGVQEVVMDGRVRKVRLPSEEMCQDESVFRVEDLCDLGHVHEASVLDTIEARFLSEKPYTRAGEVVLAVNPYKWLPIYTESIRRQHDASSAREAHVYSVSASAARGAARGDDQSILVSGESGAGKTETVKLVLGHLSSVSRGDSASTAARGGVVDRVLRAGPLLESYGNAATLRNGNSSRFAKFLRVEMDKDTMSIRGSWCETALLEKTRVVDRVAGERSFHIFYELGESASYLHPLERTATASAKSARGGSDDDACLAVVRESLALLDVTEREISDLFGAVRAVLALGSISFVDDSGGEGCCRAMGVETAARAIGCSPDLLEQGFVKREVRGHEILVDAATATASRDALAKELYRRVFQAVVELSNQATDAENANTNRGSQNHSRVPGRVVVGMLDLFGFEFYSGNNNNNNGQKNGFEQLLINFANERLQQRFVADVLSRAQQELVAEGVPWQQVEFDDNAEILRLIEGRAGLVDILNEECIRGASGSDANFVDKLLALHKDHPHLATPKIRMHEKNSALPFSISHYAGTVSYSADGWVDTNRDVLPAKLENALLASAKRKSTTGRIGSAAQLFGAFPGGGGGSSASQHKKKRGGGGNQMFSASTTVASKFRTQLRDLMASISQTKCRYVRCIRPNNAARPMGTDGAFDRVSVVEQLRCCGVLAALRVARAGYPDRKPLKDFVERFAICSRSPHDILAQCRLRAQQQVGSNYEEEDDDDAFDDEFALDPALVASCSPWREAASQIIRSIDDAQSRGYASPVSRRRRKKKKESNTLSMRVFIGKTKVFLRDGALDDLEKLRVDACYESAARIQSGFRGRKDRRVFLRTRASAVVAETLARRFLARKRAFAMRARRDAAIRVSAVARGRAVRKEGYYRRGRFAALVLETLIARPILARAKVHRARVAKAQGRRLDSITAKLRDISSTNIGSASSSQHQQQHKKIFSRGSASNRAEVDLVRAEAAATVAAAKEVASDALNALDELRRENAELRERCELAESRAETWRKTTSWLQQREAQFQATIDEARRDASVADEGRRKAHVAATISQNGSEAANAYSRLRQKMLNASNITPELRKKILEKRRPTKSVVVTRQQLKNFRRMLIDHGLDVLKHSSGKTFKRRLKLTENGELYWTMPDGHSAARSKELFPLSECTEVRAAHDVDPDSTASKLVCGTKTLRRSMEAKNWSCAFSFIYTSRTIDIQLATPEDTKVALRYCKAIVQEARTKALKVLLEQEDTEDLDDQGIPFSPHSPEHIIIR